MGSKMVRDGVGAWAKAHGVSGVWSPSPDPIAGLRKKLGEELGEYTEHNNPGELYDLQDVLARLIELSDPDGAYAMTHLRKVQHLGMFENLIEWTPVPAGQEEQVDLHPPEHNWNMPHDMLVTDTGDPNGCPPNCPYRMWYAEHEEIHHGN